MGNSKGTLMSVSHFLGRCHPIARRRIAWFVTKDGVVDFIWCVWKQGRGRCIGSALELCDSECELLEFNLQSSFGCGFGAREGDAGCNVRRDRGRLRVGGE